MRRPVKGGSTLAPWIGGGGGVLLGLLPKFLLLRVCRDDALCPLRVLTDEDTYVR